MKNSMNQTGTALGWCWWCYSTMDFEGFCTHEPEMTPILLIRLLLAPSISNPKAAPVRVWNNRIGRSFTIKLINAGYGITVLGGFFSKIDNHRGWNKCLILLLNCKI